MIIASGSMIHMPFPSILHIRPDDFNMPCKLLAFLPGDHTPPVMCHKGARGVAEGRDLEGGEEEPAKVPQTANFALQAP